MRYPIPSVPGLEFDRAYSLTESITILSSSIKNGSCRNNSASVLEKIGGAVSIHERYKASMKFKTLDTVSGLYSLAFSLRRGFLSILSIFDFLPKKLYIRVSKDSQKEIKESFLIRLSPYLALASVCLFKKIVFGKFNFNLAAVAFLNLISLSHSLFHQWQEEPFV